MNKKPGEKDIERLLGNIQPEPAKSLHERMQSAPWNQPDVSPLSPPGEGHRLRAVAAIIITALFFMTLFVTSGDVMARLVSAFFSIAPEETREHSFDVPEPTATIPQEVIQATIEARRPPIESLQQRASVEIKLPQYLPEGYIYESAYTDDEGNVQITYMFSEGEGIRRFLNIRQTGNQAQESFEVGANAIIQDIRIKGVPGEYLQGSWETEEISESDGTINIRTRWNNNTEMHVISWSVDDVYYEILYQASLYVWSDDGLPGQPGYLALDDLIAVAESLE